jgi:hypothetical protein
MNSATSRVGNGRNEMKRSNSKFSRTNASSARSRYSVIALCASQAAPMVEKLAI